MPDRTLGALVLAMLVVALGPWRAGAQLTDGGPARPPVAIADLATEAGVGLVQGQWRYHDVTIVPVEHRAPGPDLRPSGPPNRTFDIAPRAEAADFDDSAWTPLAPPDLQARKGSGRLSFAWYRIKVTVPDRVGAFDPTGSTIVFEVVVDDYAEVWVNGALPIVLGQTGGQLVKGFNAPNRVVLTSDARPGQQFQLAVFGANGPLSSPPANFIWVRSATLEFHRAADAARATPVATRIMRRDSALDRLVPPSARIEKLAGGFLFTEGPVWVPRSGTSPGHLLFSDPNANTIYRWSTDGQVTVFRAKSGYSGMDIGAYGQPGSNGLALDREGRLTINEHGNRRVTRLEKTGALTVVADRHDGKRLNSPNDLVYRSDGTLFFTDPPFGLPRFFEDPHRELSYSGVYAVIGGTLRLVTTDLQGPNGLAFSPDERYLYVGNWDVKRKVVMRYEVRPDGGLANGHVFFDMTDAPGEDAIDGIKVDERGNVYVSGPGGLWILSPAGQHLGTLVGPEHPHNMAWGDDDGRTLYLAAQTGVYRIRLAVRGAGIRP